MFRSIRIRAGSTHCCPHNTPLVLANNTPYPVPFQLVATADYGHPPVLTNVRADQAGSASSSQSKSPDEPEIPNWSRHKLSYIDKQCAIPVPFHRINVLPQGFRLQRRALMQQNYTAVLKQDAGWWIGWIEEVPGVNCQERSREALVETLRVTLREALELNRQEALGAAGGNFEEASIAV